MATPPFSLNTTVPGNTDIAATFPTLDRSDKDIVQSWIVVNHNAQGRHFQVDIDKLGTTYGPSGIPPNIANVLSIYYDATTSALMISESDNGGPGTIELLGVPAGTILDYAGTGTPAGFFLCFGQQVSRTTYARLFAAIGTTWGAGDGSTTFNLPDMRGMSAFGKDNMGGTTAGRITVAGGNINGTVLGNFGFLQNITLANTNLPSFTTTSYSPGTISLNATTSQLTIWDGTINNAQSGSGVQPPAAGGGHMVQASSTTLNVTLPSFTPTFTGAATPIGILPNLVIVNKIIKF